MNDAYVNDAEALLMELLAVPGPSGREQAVMDFIVGRLRSAGAPADALRFDHAQQRSPYGGEIGNLVLRLPGTRPGGQRLLMAHVDTVPICEGARPVRRGNWIVPADKHTGLGADDRAGTTAILAAALAILRSGLPHPPLCFLWTVQEELGLWGARNVRRAMLGRPRAAFNFDGGPFEKVTIGATGGYRMTIRITGLASHAGVAPERGVSAITIAGLAIAELHRGGWLGKVQRGNRSGTSNIGIIHGGDATNVVTPLVELHAEARSHNPAFRGRIIRAIEAAFAKAARSVANDEGVRGRVDIEGQLDYEAFRLADDDPSIEVAEEAIRVTGGEPCRAISNGGLDANWMTARDIPTVSLGCGQVNPHTASERVDRPAFHQACRVALRLATGE